MKITLGLHLEVFGHPFPMIQDKQAVFSVPFSLYFIMPVQA
jgi:hypothetical protein